MQIQTTRAGTRAVLALSGRFDFRSYRDFHETYEAVLQESGIRELVLDLDGVDYLDSSALGMLLMVREKAAVAGKTVRLTKVRNDVKRVLDIANFGKLFEIS